MASDAETTTDAAVTGGDDIDAAADPGTGADGVDDTAIAEGYAAALDELEAILAELEDDDIDVDALAGRVERASELLRYCRERIDEAEMTVERIVTDLDEPADLDDVGDAGCDDDAAAEDDADES